MRHFYICAVVILALLAAAGANAGRLARAYVVPSDVSLVAGAQQQFQVIGEDADGNEVTLPSSVTWTIEGPGNISPDGLFTASNTTGKTTIWACVDGWYPPGAHVEVLPSEPRDGYLLERIIGSLDAGKLNAPLDVAFRDPITCVLTEQLVTWWTQLGDPISLFYLSEPVTDAKLAVDSAYNVYVLDRARVRIQKYSSSGSLVKQWGSLGSANGQFDDPRSIAIDSSDHIYVADGNNKRVQVFNTDGSFITAWPVTVYNSYYWPTYNLPEPPQALTIDPAGNIYVATVDDYDWDAWSQLLKYDSQGHLLFSYDTYDYLGGDIAVGEDSNLYVLKDDSITMYQPHSDPDYPGYGTYDFSRAWGYLGNEDDMFNDARGLAISIDCAGQFFVNVADHGNNRVQVYWTFGALSDSWYSSGTRKSQLKNPSAVSLDAQGNVLVGDSGNYRVQVFDANGKFIREIASRGAKDGPFACTGGIAFGPDGNVYVTDATFSRILGYDSSGAPVSNWSLPVGTTGQMGAYGIAYNPAGYFYVTDPNLDSIITLNPSGAVVGTWGGGTDMPVGIAVDSQHMNLVADYGNNRIRRFNAGVYVNGWGTTGTASGQFQGPAGLCVDPQDNVYVADSGNCRIQKFTNRGTYLGQTGTKGFGPYDLLYPEAVATNARGDIYVADTQNHRIKKYVLYKAISTTEAKRFANGVPAEVNVAVVTAAFTDFFYIESDNRLSGIRVNKANHGMSVGMRANVVGTCSTIEGERCIDASTVTQAGIGSVEPIAMSNKALGGSNLNYDSAKGTGQQGVTGGLGLNNLGLLIRTMGRVTYSGSGFFYIDDGSKLDDGSGHTGVKVLVNGFNPPPEASYVQVTGISACSNVLGGLKRLIRARSGDDVKLLSGGFITGKVIQSGGVVPYVVESTHPYANNYDNLWTVTVPNATSIRLHFTEIETEYNHDYLYLFNKGGLQQAKYNTSTALFDQWSKWITGDTIKLRLMTDATGTRYGFKMDKYEVQGGSSPLAGVTLTVTPGGQSTVTDANGEYKFTIPQAGNYTLTPSLAGATFTPASRSVSVTAGQTTSGVDFVKN